MKTKPCVIFTILLFFLLISCRRDNILKDIKIGDRQPVWMKKLDDLKRTDNFQNFDEGNFADSLKLFKKIQINNYSIGVIYEFNDLDIYKIGNLRTLSVSFVGDTSYNFFDSTFKQSRDGHLNIGQAEAVLNYILDIYGEPDSISLEQPEELLDLFQWRRKNRNFYYYSPKYDNAIVFNDSIFDQVKLLQAYRLTWIKDGYEIIFDQNPRFTIEINNKKIELINYSKLSFWSDSYTKEISAIQDSILKNLKPSELLRFSDISGPYISTINPNSNKDYFDRILQISYKQLYRERLEERRTITAIRVNIDFTDKFNEHLAEIDGVDIDFNPPLEIKSHENGLMSGSFYFNPTGYFFGVYYRSNSEIGISLERLKLYSDVKIKISVTAVAFKDGSVLK